jgi:hypothetical protein
MTIVGALMTENQSFTHLRILCGSGKFWMGKIRIALFWVLLKFGLRNKFGLRK